VSLRWSFGYTNIPSYVYVASMELM